MKIQSIEDAKAMIGSDPSASIIRVELSGSIPQIDTFRIENKEHLVKQLMARAYSNAAFIYVHQSSRQHTHVHITEETIELIRTIMTPTLKSETDVVKRLVEEAELDVGEDLVIAHEELTREDIEFLIAALKLAVEEENKEHKDVLQADSAKVSSAQRGKGKAGMDPTQRRADPKRSSGSWRKKSRMERAQRRRAAHAEGEILRQREEKALGEKRRLQKEERSFGRRQVEIREEGKQTGG